MKKENRREFIKKTGAVTAGLAVGGSSLSAASYRRVMGANDRIQMGVIGCLRRAGAFVASFADLSDQVDIIYACDVVKSRRDEYAASIKEALGKKPKAVNDLRNVFNDTKVDGVFNLTPDHWHTPGACMALEAGKHVYVEKPLTHNPREGEIIREYRDKYGKVVFMGTQQRSQETARTIVKEIQEGLIGEVYHVLAHYTNGRGNIGNGKVMPPPEDFDWDLFQGPAPRRDYMDILYDYNWHWFWDWGTGETGNNATHEFDVGRWILQVEHPESVFCNAGKYYHTDDDWTMYDTMDVTMQYPGGKSIRWDGRSRSGNGPYDSGRGNVAFGSKGTVHISRNGYKVFDLKGKLIREGKEVTESVTTGMGGGGDITTKHIENFLKTVKGTASPNSVLEEAVASSHLNHLANIAARTGKGLKVDPTTGHILDKGIMKDFWSRDYEPGWEL